MASVQSAMPSDKMVEYLGDVWDVRKVIGMVAFCSLILGFIFMIIVKYMAACIVWASIFLYFVGLLGLTWSMF